MFLWEDTSLQKYLVGNDSDSPVYEHADCHHLDRLKKKLRIVLCQCIIY